MADTITLASRHSLRLTYFFSGDGTTPFVIPSATMLTDCLPGPLKDVLSATYADQAAMRAATIEGKVKVFIRARVMPASGGAALPNPTAKSVGAALVDPTAESTSQTAEPAASAAPVAYDQTQIQGIVDLVNDIRTKFNQAVTDITSLYTAIGTTAGAMTQRVNQLITDDGSLYSAIGTAAPAAGIIGAVNSDAAGVVPTVDAQPDAVTATKVAFGMVVPSVTGAGFYIDIWHSYSSSG